ncbi:MAG: hypothetical protein AB7V27_12985 [Candidatus Binatia bacterium]
MAQRVFFLTRLRPGIRPEDYEGWLRTVDYPFSARLRTLRRYDVTRIGGLFQGQGSAEWHYLEVMDVTDLEAYRQEVTTGPDIEAFFKAWSSFIGESMAYHGEVIE